MLEPISLDRYVELLNQLVGPLGITASALPGGRPPGIDFSPMDPNSKACVAQAQDELFTKYFVQG